MSRINKNTVKHTILTDKQCKNATVKPVNWLTVSLLRGEGDE